MTEPTPAPREPAHREALYLDLPPLRPALTEGFRLLAETIIIPTLVFGVVRAKVDLVAGLLASLGWCWGAVALRRLRKQTTPGTLLLSTAMYTARTGISLMTASAFVYLVQPAAGSLLMAVLFVATGFLRRPMALRLAHDFIRLPSELLARRSVVRMFREVSLIWGASRLLVGGLSLLAVLHSTQVGLITRGIGAPLLTVVGVAVCAWRGIVLLRADGIRVRRHQHAT